MSSVTLVRWPDGHTALPVASRHWQAVLPHPVKQPSQKKKPPFGAAFSFALCQDCKVAPTG